MKIANSYPYPVLSDFSDDYVNSKLRVDYFTKEEFGELKIQVKFQVENKGLEDLIENEKAAFILHVECPQTSYRKVISSPEPEMSKVIKVMELRGKVFLHAFIVAQSEIFDYTNSLLSDWYKGMNIKFEKGNFLGIGNALELTLHDDDTEFMDLPAIIDIHKGLQNEYMEVELHASNIIISLPSAEYESYANNANKRLKNTIISTVIFPSLIFVFSKIQENKRDLEEYTWYQVMESIFQENNYSIEDIGTERLSALKAAQLILRKPLATSFSEIEKLNSVEDLV